MKFVEAIISWKSKKQDTTARSSAKAEFRSMASPVAELTWLTSLYKELRVSIHMPKSLYCGRKAAIQLAVNPIFHERTKYIDIDCHFVKEKIVQGMVKKFHISTQRATG